MMSRRAVVTAATIVVGSLAVAGITVVRDRGGDWVRARVGSLTDDLGGPVPPVTAAEGRTGGGPILTRHSVTDGRGTHRDFIVQVPVDYIGTEPLALTFAFHGLNGKAADAMAFGIQDATGAAGASIFVFPQGMAFENYGVGWNDLCGGYDMVFFDHMLADVEARYRVDRTKVFVAGFSWGCDFVTALACCRGDMIRGIGAAACSDEYRDPADYRTYANLACPVPNKAAIRFTHDADGDSAYPAPLFASTSKLFRSMNACSSTAAQATPGSCVSYPGCANQTVECVKPGIGHSPGPHWGAETWAFFSGLR